MPLAVGLLVNCLVSSGILTAVVPELSQRTLASVMRVLDSLPPEGADTYPLLRKYWEQLLFE
jgi:hypothetical protein